MAEAPRRDLPTVDDESRPFWDAAHDGRLLVASCRSCHTVHHLPPSVLPFMLERRRGTGRGERSGHPLHVLNRLSQRAPTILRPCPLRRCGRRARRRPTPDDEHRRLRPRCTFDRDGVEGFVHRTLTRGQRTGIRAGVTPPATEREPVTATDRFGQRVTSRFPAFRTRAFRRYAVGQTASMGGTWLQNIALAWLVLEQTNNGRYVGLVGGAQFLPPLLLGAWAGTLADRIDVRRAVLALQVVLGAQATILTVLVFTDSATIGRILVLALLQGAASAFDPPIRQGLMNRIVGDEDLTNAVATNSALVHIGAIVGPMIAGILISTVGTPWCFLANAVSYAVMFGAIGSIRPTELINPAAGFGNGPVNPLRSAVHRGEAAHRHHARSRRNHCGNRRAVGSHHSHFCEEGIARRRPTLLDDERRTGHRLAHFIVVPGGPRRKTHPGSGTSLGDRAGRRSRRHGRSGLGYHASPRHRVGHACRRRSVDDVHGRHVALPHPA